MRILDDAEHIAERVAHGRGFDAITDVLHFGMLGGATGEELRICLVGVVDAPVRNRSERNVAVGEQAEFVAADVEAHVERLIEVRLLAEHTRVPGLGGRKVWRRIDDGPQAEKHQTDPPISGFIAIGDQQHASGGLAIAMMPPITRKASTRNSSIAITHFVLASMRRRMMHKGPGPSVALAARSAAVRSSSSTAGSM